MTIYSSMIDACWIFFAGYWIVSSFGAKRSVKSGGKSFLIRVALIALVLVFVRSRPANVDSVLPSTIQNPAVRTLGVVLCAGGIAFAIWARRHIGKNWGMPMTVRENPELVTSGPYAHIRHPIYTGVLIALVGNALALSLWWLVAVAAGLGYFTFAASKEEETMAATFPREYADYRNRTKMLVPGVF